MAGTEQSPRNLSDYLGILRRRIGLTLLVAVVTVGAAAAYTFRQPTLYRASMKIVIGQQGGAFQLNVGNVAGTFTQTMSDLMKSQVVAQAVIQRLGLDLTPTDLINHLDVSTKPDTSVLTVTYDDTDRARGVRILETAGSQFTELVASRLAPPSGGSQNLQVSATVFDPAHALPGQVQPKPLRNLAVAVVLGTLLGLLAAIVRDQFDDTVRSVEQAERAFGQTATVTLPSGVVGFQPFDPQESRKRDPVLTELALQKLRASLLWSLETRDARTVLVTSGNPEEGKTTIAANLAVIMAMEGLDVILVEADTRHPTIHRYLRMPPPRSELGLDAVMSGRIRLIDSLVDVPTPSQLFWVQNGENPSQAGWEKSKPAARGGGRLRAMMSPPGGGQSAEFSLGRTADMLEHLRTLCDYVIVDSAPILVVPDAYPFAVTADIVMALVRSGKSNARAVEALERTLTRLGAKRVELVVTEADRTMSDATHYGYRPYAGNRIRYSAAAGKHATGAVVMPPAGKPTRTPGAGA